MASWQHDHVELKVLVSPPLLARLDGYLFHEGKHSQEDLDRAVSQAILGFIHEKERERCTIYGDAPDPKTWRRRRSLHG